MKTILLIFLFLSSMLFSQSDSASAVSTPEMYGAKGDGITDDHDAIVKLLNSGARNITINGSYLVKGRITSHNSSNELSIISKGSGRIKFTDTASSNNYYDVNGCLTITGGTIYIKGIILEGSTTAKTYTQFNNVLNLTGCSKITIDNIHVTGGCYAGVQIINSSNITVTNSYFGYNTYAGLMIRGSKNIRIDKSLFEYNGRGYLTGYGVTLTGRYPYPKGIGKVIDNENAVITNCASFYNTRCGIDVHGGKNVMVINNIIKAFGVRAIYAVNEGGEHNYEKFVHNVLISGNYITQDSAFADSIISTAPKDEPQIGIQAGSYSTNTTTPVASCGNIEVTNNIIQNITSSHLKFAIQLMLNGSGEAADTIRIRSNKIEGAIAMLEGKPNYGIICVYGHSAKPASFTEVTGNSINGESYYGIYIQRGANALVKDNKLNGKYIIPLKEE